MGDFRHYSTGEGYKIDKEKKVPLPSLRKFGLFQDYTMFYIEQSSHKLILTSDSARIIMRKY